MVLWVFLALIVAFVVLPIIGAAIWWVIVAFFSGLFIGALARLVVPGRQSIGVLATVASGWIGSLGGYAIAGALWGFKHHNGHWFPTVLIEIAVAAIAVFIFDQIARRAPRQRTQVEVHHRIVDI